ncbi:hypothetical protein SGFS_032280 [Streptomyces graminofaciens]|uniref:Uncharacterized protein n=1 Tax=Streptomyces graminofaciens TaxID=68212 RepID=A0ABM7F7S5_9ACTN|nr:hypothetical protein SGFS_032280 [Streptomyces graminofaciens]
MFQRVPGGEHQYGQPRVLASEPAQYLHPVHIGQHPVEYDDVRGAATREPQGAGPSGAAKGRHPASVTAADNNSVSSGSSSTISTRTVPCRPAEVPVMS